jgi:hypothetical protein
MVVTNTTGTTPLSINTVDSNMKPLERERERENHCLQMASTAHELLIIYV